MIESHIAALTDRWTEMWNRERPAVEVVSADVRVYFGRTPVAARETNATSAHALQVTVDAIALALPGIRYGHLSVPRPLTGADERGGEFVLLWEVTPPGGSARSGLDLFRFHKNVITEVWSITGDLELPPMR
jgi:hypothetical protein